MLHTKTKPGMYDENDYWVVTFETLEGEKIVKEYNDADNAYEDYCYYKKHCFNCTYNHYRR